ncbi:MAG: hypothetical protein EZS28_043559 [Streblomastix strix]|uniref:Uncharacterized protein n=1 Tax=Streblomastix strix TaxID=222440 RepID=A0A5J4TRD3_9EUKA|nr:MAG: hypothetical protein EZS28_043559 [Streblomastix strix]
MIPPEKPDVIFLNNIAKTEYQHMENEEVIIDMIRNQRIINFPTQVLRTQSSNYPASNIGDGGGFIQTIMSFANIKSMFVTFAMPQYPTWFLPVLFKNIELIIDQRHVIPAAYPALTQDVCGGIGKQPENVFYNTSLNNGSKTVKVYYPNKFMLAWKLATDDSFMRRYNSSKIGSRTNIQVQLGVTPVENICDSIVPIMFDDNPDPQVLTLEVIGEIGGSAIRSG